MCKGSEGIRALLVRLWARDVVASSTSSDETINLEINSPLIVLATATFLNGSLRYYYCAYVRILFRRTIISDRNYSVYSKEIRGYNYANKVVSRCINIG